MSNYSWRKEQPRTPGYYWARYVPINREFIVCCAEGRVVCGSEELPPEKLAVIEFWPVRVEPPVDSTPAEGAELAIMVRPPRAPPPELCADEVLDLMKRKSGQVRAVCKCRACGHLFGRQYAPGDPKVETFYNACFCVPRAFDEIEEQP